MKVTTIGNRMIDGKIYVDAMCGRFPNHHFLLGADLVVREKGQAVATDAMSDAPAAGKWFDEQFFMLARNATPAR
jgi:cellulase/cellobiase CelA1